MGPVTFTAEDHFCLDGRRLVKVNGVENGLEGAEYREEVGDGGTKILSHGSDARLGPDYFEVFLRDGRVITFGSELASNPANARLEGTQVSYMPDRAARQVRIAWAVAKVRDRSGNMMLTSYEVLQGSDENGDPSVEQVPNAITYSKEDNVTDSPMWSSSWRRKVTFGYEARNDRHIRHVAGVAIASTLRLSRIECIGPGLWQLDVSEDQLSPPPGLLRSYSLHYSNASINDRSLLRSVTECDSDEHCRKPVNITWACDNDPGGCTGPAMMVGELEDIDTGIVPWEDAGPTNRKDFWTIQIADIDGDGKDDIFYRKTRDDPSSASCAAGTWYFRLSTGRGFGSEHEAGLPVSHFGSSIDDLRPVDLDGDGIPEIVVYDANPNGHNGTAKVYRFNAAKTTYDWVQDLEPSLWSSYAGSPISFPLFHVADLDGDGLPDVVRSSGQPGGFEFWQARFNSGSGTFTSPFENLGPASASVYGHVADIDGDGRPELLIRPELGPHTGQIPGCSDGYDYWYSRELYAFSYANGQFRAQNTGIPAVPFNNEAPYCEMNGWHEYNDQLWFVDVTGDGLPDAVKVRQEEAAEVDGFGWIQRRGDLFVAVNTGAGFGPFIHAPLSPVAEISPARARPQGRYVDVGVRFLDVDLDGRTEILVMDKGYYEKWDAESGKSTPQRAKPVVLHWNGSGFDEGALPGIPIGFSPGVGPGVDGTEGKSCSVDPRGTDLEWGYGQRLTQILDANGDGLGDILEVGSLQTPWGEEKPGTLHLFLRKRTRADRVIAIDGGFGRPAIKDINYQRIGVGNVDYWQTDATCSRPEQCLRHGPDVVAGYTAELTTDERRSYVFSYWDARIDRQGRGWLGFGRVSVVESPSGIITETGYDNATRWLTLYPGASRPQWQITTTPLGAGAVHQVQKDFKYDQVVDTGASSGSSHPPVAQIRLRKVIIQDSDIRDHGLTYSRSSATDFAYDAYGNTTSKLQTRWVDYDDSGTNPVGAKWLLKEVVEYYPPNESTWQISLAKRLERTSTAPTGESATRTESFDYFPSGLLAKSTREPDSTDPSLKLETTYRRNEYGLVSVVTEASGRESRVRQIDYDEVDHSFPRVVRDRVSTNPESWLSRKYWHHRGLGLLAERADENDLRTRFRYDTFGRAKGHDLFGRPASEPWPADTDVSASYRPVEPGADGLVVAIAQKGGARTEVALDPLGRQVTRRHEGFDGRWVTSRSAYDALGYPRQRSLPHFEGDPEALVESTFDTLGRPLTEKYPGGSVWRRQYDGLSTLLFDPLSHASRVTVDANGQVIQSTSEAERDKWVTTRYSYGPFGMLSTVMDPGGHSTQMGYDIRGRQTARSSPDSGTTIRTFDGWGALRTKTDANGDMTTFEYDGVGRPTAASVGRSRRVFVWDSGDNAQGKLASTLSGDGVATAYVYDDFGRIQTEVETVKNEVFSIDRQYDASGRLLTLTYPSVAINGSRVHLAARYSYAANGDLKSITDGRETVFWETRKENAFRQIESEAFGNGVITAKGHDAEGMLKSIRSDAGETAIQSLQYTYHPDRTLQSRRDSLSDRFEGFEYDALKRLRHWRVDGAQGGDGRSDVEYSYDDDGNLLGRQGWGSDDGLLLGYVGLTGGPHAAKSAQVGLLSYELSYDAAGNQTSGRDGKVDFTSFGLPKQITTEKAVVSFAYDAFHRRSTKRSTSGEETVYVGGLYERRTSPNAVTHVFSIVGAGRTLAQVQAAEGSAGARVLYFHDDHLGSVETVTDDTGAVVEHLKFGPFGARTSALDPRVPYAGPRDPVRRGFTGHEMDDDLGLINMKGRIYDPVLGRFLSPDPVVAAPLFGQSFNPYSYVLNNPLSFVDPTGFNPTCDITGTCGMGDIVPADSGGAPPGADSDGRPYETVVAGHADPFGIMDVNVSVQVTDSLDLNGTVYANQRTCETSGRSIGDLRLADVEHLPLPVRAAVYKSYLGVLPQDVQKDISYASGQADAIDKVAPSLKKAASILSVYLNWEILGLGALMPEEAVVGAEEAGSAGATAAAEGAATLGRSGTTTLFRAVGEGEFAQVMKTGAFEAGPNSLGGKFFAGSAADAAEWGEALNGAGNFRILQVELPTSTVDQMMYWQRLDGIGPAWYGELPQLGGAKITPYVP